MSREEATELAQAAGARVASSVSKKTDFVVAGRERRAPSSPRPSSSASRSSTRRSSANDSAPDAEAGVVSAARLPPMPVEIDIDHVALLARLDLTDEEKDRLRVQLGAILEHAARVGEVAADDVPPTAWAIPRSSSR